MQIDLDGIEGPGPFCADQSGPHWRAIGTWCLRRSWHHHRLGGAPIKSKKRISRWSSTS